MVPLPTYQEPILTKLSEPVITAQVVNEPENTVVADATAPQHVYEPDTDATDMSPVPVLCRESSNHQKSEMQIVLTINTFTTLMSRPIPPPRKIKNDISANPSGSPLHVPSLFLVDYSIPLLSSVLLSYRLKSLSYPAIIVMNARLP